jgi:tetratricopeptide (TPR) repeat protein
MKQNHRRRSVVFTSTTVCLLVLAASCPRPGLAAQDYAGAAAVLQKVADQSAKPEADTQKTDERSKLRDELTAFQGASATLPAAEAAQRWLGLADRAAKLSGPQMTLNEPVPAITSAELFEALPPPADWPELARAIATRPAAKGDGQIREIGLQLLAAALTGNQDDRQHVIADLQAKTTKADMAAAFRYKSALDRLNEATLTLSDDPDVVLKSLERRLSSMREDRNPPLRVPNLVSIAGAAKAEAFLRRALLQRNVTLEFEVPDETSRLAQKLALEMIDQLPSPQWGLINSLDSIDLYAAMDKHFGAHDTNSAPDQEPGDMSVMNNYGEGSQKTQAQVYYLLSLISHNRTKEAVVVAKKLGNQGQIYMPEEAFKAMDRTGYTAALDDFFYEVLSQDPGLPFWDEYVLLAARTGKTDRMLKLARAAAANDDLSSGRKTAIHQNLAKALLAADELDEGVAQIRALLAATNTPAPSDNINAEAGAGELGIDLARIGMLTERPEWTDEGIKAAQTWLADEHQSQDTWESPQVAASLAAVLSDLKRGPEAEAVLTDALTRVVRANAAQQNNAWNNDNTTAQLLTELAMLYDKAGRSADVLALLDQAPWWGAKDVNELFQLQAGENRVALAWLHAQATTISLPCLAARALAATGRKDEAMKITDALLNHEPGIDRGYELLLQLGGSNVIPRLDEQFARDQFEERPLIWKAHVLRQQGQLEEAEKIARQAIAIDPSDGEEGPGDRMRAYTELADVLEERGAATEAQTYRGAVTAIRLSEQADQFYLAGLLKRAIKMYEESLTHFADAYCIQSRLAIQLSALGLNQQAEEHYRRAYELMPDSFGRVESHCFGCERAFDGEHAQSIAEKVFEKIAAERPNKPQVHYLLGYLREEQEEYNEAASNYLDAVRLDPDYLNAWSRLQGIGANILMPAPRRDEVLFNILRLDPLQRHSNPDFGRASDLVRLWNTVAAGASRRPPKTPPLLTLTASKAALESKKKTSPNRFEEFTYTERLNSEQKGLTPGAAIAQTPFVMVAGELLGVEGNSMTDD